MDACSNIHEIGDLLNQITTEMKVRDNIPLKRDQAAWYLGVCLSTIDNYVSRGLLKKQVRNGLYGYMIEDLNKLKKK